MKKRYKVFRLLYALKCSKIKQNLSKICENKEQSNHEYPDYSKSKENEISKSARG